MAIKVNKKEVDVETEIMNKLSEYGLSIDFGDDDSEEKETENKTEEKEKEANN